MRWRLSVIAFAVLVGCSAKVPEELQQHYTERPLYTCCNMFYQGDEITDANYREGTMIPVGSPVTVKKLGSNSITFEAAGSEMTLEHLYGAKQESFKQYFDKILVKANRGEMVASFPPIIRKAIEEGRIETGMKRGEVVLAVGFPPLDDNPSPEAPEWKYWYSKGKSYTVTFDANGYVSAINGQPAPTRGKPVRIYSTQRTQ